MNLLAYWISPAGRILNVPMHHIDLVISEPATFGLSLRKIKATYKRYEEPLHLEGLARESLMTGIIKKGWIRVRYVGRGDYFIVQPWILDAKTKRHIRKWAMAICGKVDHVPKHTGFKIACIGPEGQTLTGTLADLISAGNQPAGGKGKL